MNERIARATAEVMTQKSLRRHKPREKKTKYVVARAKMTVPTLAGASATPRGGKM
jgi:hypothetical protein